MDILSGHGLQALFKEARLRCD